MVHPVAVGPAVVAEHLPRGLEPPHPLPLPYALRWGGRAERSRESVDLLVCQTDSLKRKLHTRQYKEGKRTRGYTDGKQPTTVDREKIKKLLFKLRIKNR